mmetsp:Transcript_29525/g.76575  ORF Transcript_29525/g.76575 Transcript_29525/m.76575 type:complete len:314 (+) Transcript_29525:1052-1993(+)
MTSLLASASHTRTAGNTACKVEGARSSCGWWLANRCTNTMASSLCAAQGLTQTRCTRDGSSEPNTDSHGPGPTCPAKSASCSRVSSEGALASLCVSRLSSRACAAGSDPCCCCCCCLAPCCCCSCRPKAFKSWGVACARGMGLKSITSPPPSSGGCCSLSECALDMGPEAMLSPCSCERSASKSFRELERDSTRDRTGREFSPDNCCWSPLPLLGVDTGSVSLMSCGPMSHVGSLLPCSPGADHLPAGCSSRVLLAGDWKLEERCCCCCCCMWRVPRSSVSDKDATSPPPWLDPCSSSSSPSLPSPCPPLLPS